MAGLIGWCLEKHNITYLLSHSFNVWCKTMLNIWLYMNMIMKVGGYSLMLEERMKIANMGIGKGVNVWHEPKNMIRDFTG